MAFGHISFNNLKDLYQEGIDSLIDNVGKNVTIVFDSTVTNVTDEYFDQNSMTHEMKPSFKEDTVGEAPVVTDSTRTIKALTKWEPKEFQNYGIRVNNPEGIVRLKTYLTDLPDLLRSNYIIVNSNVKDVITCKCRLIRKPMPFGFKEDRYARTYWEVFA